MLATAVSVHAIPKPHVITFGKWTTVKFFLGPNEKNSMDLKIRPLMVDGKVKEFTTGEPHTVTDRFFVVQAAFRVNDTLPEDAKNVRWKWQRGGWLLVDRSTGHVSKVNLPEFDPYYSLASWFRDYVAYCGVSDNGEKLSAVVAQVGRKKPVVKKALGLASNGDTPDSECETPSWQREPTRVTFAPKRGEKFTYSVFAHATELGSTDAEEEE